MNDVKFEIFSTMPFSELKNGELGKFFGSNKLYGIAQDKFNIGYIHLGEWERDEQEYLFAKEYWLPIDKLKLILSPIFNVHNFEFIPEHIKLIMPHCAFSWVWAAWWREKIPKGFFSKSKSLSGNFFDLVISKNLKRRKSAYNELKEINALDIIPTWVKDSLVSDNVDLSKLYLWANRMENLINSRLLDLEMNFFKELATESCIISKKLAKAIEKDLNQYSFWSKNKVSRAGKSFDRYRKHDPFTALPKNLKKIYEKDDYRRSTFEKSPRATSYSDLKKKTQRGRPKKIRK